MEAYDSRGNSLRDFLRVIFRCKLLIVITMMVVFSVIYINMQLRTPVAVASVKMLVVASKIATTDYYKGLSIRSGGYIANTQVEIVRSRPVIERVVKALKLYQRPVDYEKQYAPWLRAALIERNAREFNQQMETLTIEQRDALLYERAVGNLTGSVSAVSKLDTDIFYIKVADVDPDMAARLVNSVSRSYLIYDLEQQIAALILQYGGSYPIVLQIQGFIDELYGTLDGRILPHLKAIGPATVKILEQARRGALKEPPGMLAKIPGIASVVLGLFFGIFLAFVFDYLDHTFKSPQDVKKYLNLPLLGTLPRRKKKTHWAYHLQPRPISKRRKKSQDKLFNGNGDLAVPDYSRSYQNLANNIFLLMKSRSMKSLVIADLEGSEDTSVIIANLGIYLAHQAGHKVLIIDANLRAPSLARIFDISDGPGLINVLERSVPFEGAVQDLGAGLHVLAAGENLYNPSTTLLDSASMYDVIKKERAKDNYELILINCADLKDFTDAMILSSTTDGLVLTINEGSVRRQAVDAAIENLEQNKVNIAGVIFNNRTYVIPEIVYKLS